MKLKLTLVEVVEVVGGERWTVTECVDSYKRSTVLQLIESIIRYD